MCIFGFAMRIFGFVMRIFGVCNLNFGSEMPIFRAIIRNFWVCNADFLVSSADFGFIMPIFGLQCGFPPLIFSARSSAAGAESEQTKPQQKIGIFLTRVFGSEHREGTKKPRKKRFLMLICVFSSRCKQ